MRSLMMLCIGCAVAILWPGARPALFGQALESGQIAAGERNEASDMSPRTVLIRNICVFDVESGSMSPPQEILIEGRTIARIGDLAGISGADREIDGAGRFAIPGLFDCHTHLAHLLPKGEDSLRFALGGFVERGILHVRDVGGPIDRLSEMRRRVDDGDLPGPTIFYTGPMLERSPLTWEKFNAELPGFTVAIDSREAVDSLLPALASGGASMVKTFNKLDRDVYRHLVRVADSLSLRIVHDPGTPLFHRIPMDEAIELGITSIEHAKAPWPAVLRDDLKREHDSLLSAPPEPGARSAFMMKVVGMGIGSISPERLQSLGRRMVEKAVFLCPTLEVFASMEEMAIQQSKERQGIEEIPPPMLEGIRRMTRSMEDVSVHFVRELAAGGVRMLVGQDGADPAGTASEMRRLRACGIEPAEILRGATIYPAAWLGIADRTGSIAVGRDADIVILEANPLEEIGNVETVSQVIQRGEIVATSSR